MKRTSSEEAYKRERKYSFTADLYNDSLSNQTKKGVVYILLSIRVKAAFVEKSW